MQNPKWLHVRFNLMLFISVREANQLSEEMKRDTEFAVTLQVRMFIGKHKKLLLGICGFMVNNIEAKITRISCCESLF